MQRVLRRQCVSHLSLSLLAQHSNRYKIDGKFIQSKEYLRYHLHDLPGNMRLARYVSTFRLAVFVKLDIILERVSLVPALIKKSLYHKHRKVEQAFM